MDDFYAPYTPAGVKPTTAGGSASPPPTGDFYAPYTPAGIQPEDTPDQYAGRAEAAGVKIGRTPEENQDYLRRSGQYSTDQLKEFDKRYRLAVAKEKYRGTTPGGFIEAAGRMTLPFGDFLGVRGENNYGKAKDRVNSGQAKPEDYDTVARYERLQQHDQEVGSTFGGALLQGMAGIPKMVGEAWGAGKVLGAVGGVVGGKVGGFIAGTGGAGAEIESYSLANPAFRNAVTTHAGRMALLTPLMPSMYLEEARQANLDAGRSADDPTGFPAAMLHGYSNMLVLGTMQKQFGGGNLLQRSLAKGAVGVGEQAVADVAGTAWNQIAPDILKINTQGGVLGDLARGKFGDAASHAAVQMLTFSAFAGLHDQGSMAEQKQRIKDEVDAQVKKFNGLVEAAKAEAEAKDKAAAEKAHAEGVESFKEAANFKGYKGTIEQHAVEKASEEIGQQIEEKTAEQIHEDNVRLASNKAYSDTYVATKGDRAAAEKAAADAAERVNAAKEGREPTVASEQQLTPDQVGQKTYADAIRAGKHPAEANRLAMEAQGKAMPAAPVPEPAPEQKLTPEQVGQKTYADAIRSGLNPAAANRMAREAQGKAMQEEAAARPGLGEPNTPVTATPESPTNAPVEPKTPVGDSSPPPKNAQPGASQEAASGEKPAESQAAAPVPAASGTQTPVTQTPAAPSTEAQTPAQPKPPEPVYTKVGDHRFATVDGFSVAHPEDRPKEGSVGHREFVENWVQHAIGTTPGLTDKQKADYHQGVKNTLARMNPFVQQLVSTRIERMKLFGDARELVVDAAREALSRPGRTAAKIKELQDILADEEVRSGGYVTTEGGMATIRIDDGGEWHEGKYGSKDISVEGVWAHELGHVIDPQGKRYYVSDTKGWDTAFNKEMLQNEDGEYKLTSYAASMHSEAFAEFTRLLYGSDIPLEQIIKDFPMASAFFESRGLWPEPRESKSLQTKIGELFKKSVELDNGRIDILDDSVTSVPESTPGESETKPAKGSWQEEAAKAKFTPTDIQVLEMAARRVPLDEIAAKLGFKTEKQVRLAIIKLGNRLASTSKAHVADDFVLTDEAKSKLEGMVPGGREYKMIVAKLSGGGYEAIGKEHGITKEGASKAVDRALEKMKLPPGEKGLKVLREQISGDVNLGGKGEGESKSSMARFWREGEETDTVNSLLRAIQDHPNDRTLRLVMADAIQESGDEARAERIRKDINNPPGENGVSSAAQLEAEQRYQARLSVDKGRHQTWEGWAASEEDAGRPLEFKLPANPDDMAGWRQARDFGPRLYHNTSPGEALGMVDPIRVHMNGPGNPLAPEEVTTKPRHKGAFEARIEFLTEHMSHVAAMMESRHGYERGDISITLDPAEPFMGRRLADSVLSIDLGKGGKGQSRYTETAVERLVKAGWKEVKMEDGSIRLDSPLRQRLREEQALGYRTGEPRFARFPTKKELKGVLDRALSGKEKEDGGGIKGWLIRNFTGPGHLGKKAFEAKLDSDNIVKAYASDVSQGFDDLTKVVGGDWRKVPKAEMERMNEAMTNKAVRDSLPGPVRDVLERFRSQIDALSNKLIELGVISEKLAAVFKSNLGVYMTRQYRAFTDPNWYSILKSTDEGMATINRFKAWYADEARKMGRGIMTDEQLNGVVDAYLKNDTKHDNPISFITHSKLGSKDIGLLTARKEYPEPLRALWGEIKDPVANYATSIGRMANLIANHIFLHRVKDIGLAEGWLHTEAKEGFGELISGKGSHGDLLSHLQPSEQNKDEMTLGMGPLANMYTSKPIREAFEQFYHKEQLPNYLKAYMKILSLTKYAKTVLSPTAHLRQTLGNVFFNIANGHGVSKEANKMLGEMWRGTDDGKRYRRELIERGILDQSVHGNEFKDILRDASEAHDPFTMSAKIVENGMARWLKKGMSWATKSYHWEDAFVKVHAFENEKARYAEANPTWSKEQVSQKAAEIVSKTFPTYSRVPYAIKWLRRFPLMGPFVSFTSEIVRSTFNTAKLAREEMQDPATRAIGAKRMAGLAVSMSAFAALGAVSRMIAGVSLDEEDSIRHFLPEWNKDSQLLHLGKDENGKYRVIDLGRTDPHSYLMEPFQAGLSGARTGTWSLFNNMEPALKPFIGEEIGTRAMFDIARNKMEQGGGLGEGKVYNPESSLAAKVGAIGSHLLKGVEPGLVDEFLRTGGAALGVPPNENGKPRSVGEELLADFTGQRVAGADPKEALHFAGKTYQERMKNADQELNASVARAKQQGMRLKPEDVGEQYSRGETMRRAVFDDLMNDVNAARMMGLSDGQIVRELKSGGVSQDVIGHLLGGKYVPRNVAEVVNRR